MVTATLADRYPAALHIFRNYEQPFEEPHSDRDDVKRFPHVTPPSGEGLELLKKTIVISLFLMLPFQRDRLLWTVYMNNMSVQKIALAFIAVILFYVDLCSCDYNDFFLIFNSS